MKQSFTCKVIELMSNSEMVTHLSRKKCMASCILAMISSRSVQLNELAGYMNDEVEESSNEVRLQDFFREVHLNYERAGAFLAGFLPAEGKVSLTLDRTEWDFGKCQVNILMVLASSGKIHVPLYWELLDNKSGNSSTADRIEVLEKCETLLGACRIGLVLADREFIGHKWLKYLKDRGIRFCVRMPKHHLLTNLQGDTFTIEQKLAHRQELYLKDVMVDGVWGNAWVRKLKHEEWLFVFSTAETHLQHSYRSKGNFLGQLYRKRWRIETFFQAFKTRGFNLRKTHLKALHKLKKLLALVSIAFSLCISLGVFLDQKVKPIRKKKHGYKAKSFFRHGLNFMRKVLKREGKELKKPKHQQHLQTIMMFMNSIYRQIFENKCLTKIVG